MYFHSSRYLEPTIKAMQIWCVVRASFLAHEWLSSSYVLTRKSKKSLSQASFIRTLILFVRAHSASSNYLQKTLLLDVINLGATIFNIWVWRDADHYGLYLYTPTSRMCSQVELLGGDWITRVSNSTGILISPSASCLLISWTVSPLPRPSTMLHCLGVSWL